MFIIIIYVFVHNESSTSNSDILSLVLPYTVSAQYQVI